MGGPSSSESFRETWRNCGGRTAALLSAVLLVSAAGGCVQPKPTADQLARGYIVLLPGVENQGWSMAGVVAGLRDAGIDRAIEINQWGVRPFGTFRNLKGYKVNRTKAAAIAGALTDYQRRYPDAPITLIGYSAGGAMAVFTAEALPAETRLDRIILLAAAISPGYDLSGAVGHCRRGLINFYSPHDRFMLGWGHADVRHARPGLLRGGRAMRVSGFR